MAPIRCCFDQTAVWHSDAARGPSTPSFNELVGEQLDRVGHLDAERSGRLQVDHELKFRRLQDRQVGGLGALENLTGIRADLTIHLYTIRRVAHQPANFDSHARRVARGNAIDCCKRGQLHATARKEYVASDVQGFGSVAHKSSECRLDLALGASLEDLNLQSHYTGCLWYGAKRVLGGRDIGWIDQHRNANGPGHQLVQKCQPLCVVLTREKIDPR